MSDKNTTRDVTAALSPVDLLANDILADPEIAGLYPDPAAVIVELAARANHLRRRLALVREDLDRADDRLTAKVRECQNLSADNDRLTDAAMWFAAKVTRRTSAMA